MIKPIIQELTTLPKGEDEESKVIKAVTPLSMTIMVPKAEDDSYSVIARVTWLCKEVNNYFFCLTTTYVSESDDDDEFLALCPLSEERYFVNYSITSDLLTSTLAHYLTNLDFKFKYPDNIHKINETEIFCQAYEKREGTEDKLHKIMVTPEVYGTLSFVDNYFLSTIHNNADLHSAILFGADESNNTIIFEVSDIEILDAARYSKDSLAVRTKVVYRSHTGKSTSSIELMIVAGIDKTKKKLKKFITKKDKCKELGETYMKTDENQFIQRYSFTSQVSEDSEEEYMFVKAVNMNKDGLLVGFSHDMQVLLADKISEFSFE